jgi:hypothetical protein
MPATTSNSLTIDVATDELEAGRATVANVLERVKRNAPRVTSSMLTDAHADAALYTAVRDG